ncbi:LamG-like jellyroll fold domain-containing protein [Vibrio harveyi]|uniref:LamG-like jellyroll fold domain-containing protein n=1 Tax=Vibrio harveyi TaxID=669 RepID=UPI003CF50C30
MKIPKLALALSLIPLSFPSFSGQYIISAYRDQSIIPGFVEDDWINVGSTFGCGEWSPNPSTVDFGTKYPTNRSCKQKQSQVIEGETFYREIIAKEQSEDTGLSANLVIQGETSLEYQNKAALQLQAIETSEASGITYEWANSDNVLVSNWDNNLSVFSNAPKGNAWVKYRMRGDAGLISEWSPQYNISLVDDWVDVNYLDGSRYIGNQSSIGASAIDSTFTLETWVKPHKAIPYGTVAGNAAGKIDGTNGQENYVFLPSHGGTNTGRHGFGLSVGTNGLKVFAHSAGYMPALFVSYRDISSKSWNHIAVSVQNNAARVYLNGNYIGTAQKPYAGTLFSSTSIGSYSSYGPINATLAHTRVWNKNLTDSDISSLYKRNLPTSFRSDSGATLLSVKNN